MNEQEKFIKKEIGLKKESPMFERKNIMVIAKGFASQIVDLILQNGGNISEEVLRKVFSEYFSVLETKSNLEPYSKDKSDSFSYLEEAIRNDFENRINIGLVKDRKEESRKLVDLAIYNLNKSKGLI